MNLDEKDEQMEEPLSDELNAKDAVFVDEEEEDPKKDKVIQNKFVFVLLCLLMFSLPLLWFFGIGNPVNADAIMVGEIRELTDGKLEIPLMLADSAVAFTITAQDLEDDVLIIKPRFTLCNLLHDSGNVVVTSKAPADKLKEIWIQGDDETDRQRIWINEEK